MSSCKSSQSQVSHGGGYQFGPKQIHLGLDTSLGEQLELSRIHSNSFYGSCQKGSSSLERTCSPAALKIVSLEEQSVGKKLFLF